MLFKISRKWTHNLLSLFMDLGNCHLVSCSMPKTRRLHIIHAIQKEIEKKKKRLVTLKKINCEKLNQKP